MLHAFGMLFWAFFKAPKIVAVDGWAFFGGRKGPKSRNAGWFWGAPTRLQQRFLEGGAKNRCCRRVAGITYVSGIPGGATRGSPACGAPQKSRGGRLY